MDMLEEKMGQKNPLEKEKEMGCCKGVGRIGDFCWWSEEIGG
jgi:hypothetical protein